MRADRGQALKQLARGLVRADRTSFALVQSMAVQFGVLAINLATGVLTARLLGPEGRGIFAAVTTWPQLLASLAIAGLGNALIVSMRRAPDAYREVAGAGFLIGAVSASLAVAVGFLLLPTLLQQYGPSVLLLAQICLVGTFTNLFQMLFKQIFAGRGAYPLFNLSNLLPPLLYLFGLLLVIAVGGLTPASASLCLIISAFVALVAVTPALIRIAHPAFRGVSRQFAVLWSYTARAFTTDAVGALANYVDRLILIPLISAEALGFYVVAFSFSRIILIVQPAINSVFLSHLSERTAEQAKTVHDHAFRFSLYGLALATVVLILVDRWLLSLIYGPEFGAAAVLFRILLCEAALGCLAQVAMQLYFALDRPGFVSIVQAISLAISLAGMAVLVPRYGADGAALGVLVAATARLAMLWVGIRVQLGLSLPRPYLTRSDLAYLLQRFR